MNDKVFIDTNILVFCYSKTDVNKQTQSRALLEKNDCFVSTQVLQELVNVLRKKFRIDYSHIERVLSETVANCSVFVNSEETVFQALRIGERYGYSFYDSLIVASCLASSCVVLYSEDMQHRQVIDGRVQIVNPFLET